MTDARVETHVVVDSPATNGRSAIHFQEWWVRHRAELAAESITQVGAAEATPAPGVTEAILSADLVLFPP
jgi:LPPG:FO 2-phospho-L-lactate transferase